MAMSQLPDANRRDFLQLTAAGLAGLSVGGNVMSQVTDDTGVPSRQFGRTN
jgi:hypothetical protein